MFNGSFYAISTQLVNVYSTKMLLFLTTAASLGFLFSCKAGACLVNIAGARHIHDLFVPPSSHLEKLGNVFAF